MGPNRMVRGARLSLLGLLYDARAWMVQDREDVEKPAYVVFGSVLNM